MTPKELKRYRLIPAGMKVIGKCGACVHGEYLPGSCKYFPSFEPDAIKVFGCWHWKRRKQK